MTPYKKQTTGEYQILILPVVFISQSQLTISLNSIVSALPCSTYYKLELLFQ